MFPVWDHVQQLYILHTRKHSAERSHGNHVQLAELTQAPLEALNTLTCTAAAAAAAASRTSKHLHLQVSLSK